MNTPLQPTSLELFAGAGGLALGIERAGFRHLALIENDGSACETLKANSLLGKEYEWAIIEEDVQRVDFSYYNGHVDLLAAGAPCQPWSLGGKHRGLLDKRNLFPEVFRAAREILPKVVLVENVQGILRRSFSPFFNYFLEQLSAPHVTRRADETWQDHSLRLRELIRTDSSELTYTVAFQRVDAANYGVPQRRRRVFMIAIRNDLVAAGAKWGDLEPTHSEEALLYSQWVTGQYWDEHETKQPATPQGLANRIDQLRALLLPPQKKRWRTVRDALSHLPEPTMIGSAHIPNHVARPGARAYPGHTGSAVDEPSKTLKAGDHGVPGGENMMRYPDGRVRYFSVREAAALQGFPDDYLFPGPWSEAFRQLGNAVPVPLAYLFAAAASRIINFGSGVTQVRPEQTVQVA